MSKGCDDVYKAVYAREKASGSLDEKARAYANVARANCESAGKGDKK